MPQKSLAALGLLVWVPALLASCSAWPSPVGDVTAGVSIKRPYGVQALTGKVWKTTDVFTYEATLYRLDDGVPVATAPASVLSASATKFTFVGLTRGKVYRVAIVAKGNDGGTASDETLNAEHPATADLDLTLATSASIQELAVTVQLDGETLNPTLPVQPLPPTEEGGWDVPEDDETLETTDAPTQTYRVTPDGGR